MSSIKYPKQTKWNSKKFLDALEAMRFTPPDMPSVGPLKTFAPPQSNFGQYMAARAYGVPQSGKFANTIGQESDSGWKSALGNTFSWLGSLGTGVENLYYDIKQNAESNESPGQKFLHTLEDEGKTALRLADVVTEPVREIVAGPGFKTPWENVIAPDEADERIKEQFHVRNGHVVSGADILQQQGVNNKWAKAIGGFGLDVATDPLTYIGSLGLGKKFVGATKARLGLASGADVSSKLEKLAAGLPTETLQTAVPKVSIPAALGKAKELPGFVPKQAPFDLSLGETAVRGGKVPQFSRFAPTEIKTTIPSQTFKLPEATIPEEVLTNAGKTTVERNLPELEQFARPATVFNTSKSFAPYYNLTKNTGQVIGKRGINPHVVEQAAERAKLPATAAPVYNPVAGATGHGLVVANKMADRVAKNLLQNGKKELTPARQTTLYNTIFKETASHPTVARLFGSKVDSPEALAWRRQEALRQLKSAEDSLSKRGLPGTHFNGTAIRLSEVIGQYGNSVDPAPILKAFTNPNGTVNEEVQNIISQAVAQRATATGAVAKVIYDGLSPTLNELQKTVSPRSFEQILSGAKDEAYRMAQTQGLTSKEASHVRDLVKEWTGQDEVGSWSLHHVVSTVTPKVAKAIARGETPAEAVGLIRKAVSKEIDQATGKITPVAIADRVKNFTALNFTTWMGRGSSWDVMRSEYSTVQVFAKARAEAFSSIAKNYKKDQVRLAFKLAQRPELMVGVTDSKIVELANKFRDYFDNVLGNTEDIISKGTKLKDVTDVNGTVAFRSGLVRKDINDSLKAIGSKFQFKDMKGADWYTSWRNYDPEVDMKSDPLLFMYNLDVAIHRTLAKYNVMDSFAETFGRRAGEQGFDPVAHTVSFPYGSRIDSSIKFNQAHVAPFKRLLEDYDKGPWKPESQITRMLTTGLRKWKSSVTIYYPSHHIRNIMGDSWLMWMSGISDPTVFTKSLKILRSQRSRYAEVIQGADFNELERFLKGGYRQTVDKKIVTSKRGVDISADEYYGEAMQRGLLLDAARIEDLYGDSAVNIGVSGGTGPLSRVLKPLGGRGHAAASKVSEVREHYVRMAHFVGYTEKHLSKGLVQKLAKTTDPQKRAELLKPLFDQAAKEVKKWHPDGTDMTYFEQKWMRNIIPFYSWSRKAIPLTIEGMFMSPAKILAYPRGMAAIQVGLGMDTQGVYDPFPQDKIFPDWMTAGGIGPIGDPQSSNPWVAWFGKLGRNAINPFGKETGATIIDPARTAIPFNSTIADFGGTNPGLGSVVTGLASNITPVAQIPADLLRNRTETGSPISKGEGGEGYPSYVLGQTPQTQLLQRLTGIGKDYQSNIEPGFNYEALINTLTGAGITGSGKYQKSAEFQQKQRASKQAAKEQKKRQAYLDQIGLGGLKAK